MSYIGKNKINNRIINIFFEDEEGYKEKIEINDISKIY